MARIVSFSKIFERHSPTRKRGVRPPIPCAPHPTPLDLTPGSRRGLWPTTCRRPTRKVTCLFTHRPVWRNWQTRRIQNPLVATPCGFESLHRHSCHTDTRCGCSRRPTCFYLSRRAMGWIRYISALIAVVSLCLWVVSHYYLIEVQYTYKMSTSLTFSSGFGQSSLGVSHGGIPQPPSIGWSGELRSVKEIYHNFRMTREFFPDMKPPDEYLSYGYNTFNFTDPGGKWTWSGADFSIPTWLPVLLFGLWPAIALIRHIKRRYFTHGVCRKCGYDLRGTPSGVCPECGDRAKSGGYKTI